MRKDLLHAALAVIAFTVLLGLAYPLAVTGIAQVAFPGKADGDRSLLARPYATPTGAPDPRYFQPRPSQSDYSATATFFSNRGPNQGTAAAFYRDELRSYLDLERPYDPGLTGATVPQDAVTTSASGLDVHISPANAAIQSRRVAAVRHLPPARVRALIRDHTDGRAFGLFGQPGVSVVGLNAALDEDAS